ncbi:MAG TPA: hypothetical protein VFN29_03105 [Chiayiivirga sp.]|nr:hypothetical protein [Chiayiivirga sp.]
MKPNKALQPTVLPSLRYGKTAAEFELQGLPHLSSAVGHHAEHGVRFGDIPSIQSIRAAGVDAFGKVRTAKLQTVIALAF